MFSSTLLALSLPFTAGIDIVLFRKLNSFVKKKKIKSLTSNLNSSQPVSPTLDIITLKNINYFCYRSAIKDTQFPTSLSIDSVVNNKNINYFLHIIQIWTMEQMQNKSKTFETLANGTCPLSVAKDVMQTCHPSKMGIMT